MGRLQKEEGEQEKLVYKYFGHEHPLELIHTNETGQIVSCAICSLDILPGRKGYYTCSSCPFALHALCFKFPRKIHHPAEPNHDLVLGQSHLFQCKACGNPGSGFSYTCKVCFHHYHTLCTIRPISISYKFHDHPLKLQFSPPYEGSGGFLCNICRKPGGNHWVYHCRLCEYDAHLDCANSEQNPVEPQPQAATPSPVTFEAPANVSISGSPSPSSQAASPYIAEKRINTIRSPSAGVPITNQANPVRLNPVLHHFPSVSTTNLAGSSASSLHGTSNPTPTGFNQGSISNLPNGIQSSLQNPSPAVSYGPTNQTYVLGPNGVPVPVTVLPANQAHSYGNQVIYPSNQGGQSGIGGLLVGATASGIGQAAGQEFLQSVIGGNDSDSSSLGIDGTETFTSWVGGSDVY